MLTDQLGSRLRQIRVSADLSLVEVAVRSDLDHTFIARVETGGRAPSHHSLDRICTALQVTPAQRRELMALAGFAEPLDPVVARLADALAPGGVPDAESERVRRSVTRLLDYADVTRRTALPGVARG